MFRLLALLQLTRAALAFTAIADAWAVLLLRMPGAEAPPMWQLILLMAVTGIVSAGLYGFGMSLNDLLDARRDRIFAPRRPIPSGRIPIRSAFVVSLLLLMGALFAAAALTPLHVVRVFLHQYPTLQDFIPWSFLFAFATAVLIVFYDATSKYLGGIGLLTLGTIRALHCLIGHPKTPLLFLSMFLLTHVVIISTISYKLENKRPRLHRWDYVTIVAGLILGNGLALSYMFLRGVFDFPVGGILIGLSSAAVVYAAWAVLQFRNKSRSPRQTGERLMLMGLFWLFVYDAAALVANAQYLAGLAITLLLICAVISFFTIRFLSRMINQPKLGYRTQRTEHTAPPHPG